MKTKAQFNGLLKKAIASESNPLQAIADFVFTDFLPNKNKQGIRETEAQNIIKSGLNMPVKVDFLGNTIGEHDNAIPIGNIIELSQDGDKIIGKAVIWKGEFPDFYEYLRESSASEGGINFSWELLFGSSELDSDGVQWLNDCIVAGTAVVGTPAYSGRTPLLSIASANSRSKQEFITQLSNNMEKLINAMDNNGIIEKRERDHMDLEAALARIEELTVLNTQLTEQVNTASAAASELESLKAEVSELRSFKETVELDRAQAELLNRRSKALSGILSSEDFVDNAEFIAGLSEDQFAKYITSLQAVANKKSATSSDKTKELVPDSTITNQETGHITIKDIAHGILQVRADNNFRLIN